MEFSGLAVFGMYLFLAFVIPGFCYLAIMALWAFCFPEFVPEIPERFCARKSERPGGDAKKEGFPTALVTLLAIVVGLFLSAVAFSVELCLRHCRWFPDMRLDRIAGLEASGKSTLYLQMLAGSTIMHINVAFGILLLLPFYFYALGNRFSTKDQTIRQFWSRNRKQTVLILGLAILAFCNLMDSHELAQRTISAISNAEEAKRVAEMKPSKD
jgi:hypothetical protein